MESSMNNIGGVGLEAYLSVAAMMFVIGIFGIFLNRKNVIVILMSIELMLLAVNINLVAFSAHLGDLASRPIWAIWSARSSPCSC
jgi:NADH-quinone oxidoreductase subunit K